MEQNKIRLFISHSSKDEIIVKLLVDLIVKALHMSASEIRCTSLPGYRLPLGTSTQKLRKESRQAQVLVAVLTPNAISSVFTMLEIGCRWGTGKTMLPIVCDKEGISILSGPLKDLNAAVAIDAPSIHEFLDSLSDNLGQPLEKTAVYEELIDNLATYIKAKENTSQPYRSGIVEDLNKESFAVKEISSKYSLWKKKEGECNNIFDIRNKTEDLIEGDYKPGAVFSSVQEMYAPFLYQRIDKRYEIECEVRKTHKLLVGELRIQQIKEEAYKDAKDYYSFIVDKAFVATEQHIVRNGVGEYKVTEYWELPKKMKDRKLTNVIEYINAKSEELEAACAFAL